MAARTYGQGRGRTALAALERELLALLWTHGPMSRWEAHERTGIRPNSIGDAAAGLLKRGIARESEAVPRGTGRPRTPLEIDPRRRNVVGVALELGRLSATRLTLRGEPEGPRIEEDLRGREPIPRAIDRALSRVADRNTIAAGVSLPGLIDQRTRSLLISSAAPDEGVIDLSGIGRALRGAAVSIDNNMHAMAARFRLARRAAADEDLLLVRIEDGAIGAAVLVGGRPNRGCVSGANELGHTRFPIETARCYCGHTGCLERICSTEWLRLHGGRAEETLDQACEAPGAPGSAAVVEHLSRAIANAVNFMRPHRVVLSGGLAAHAPFAEVLQNGVVAALFPALAARVAFERWEESPVDAAANAAFLAIAGLFDPAWG